MSLLAGYYSALNAENTARAGSDDAQAQLTRANAGQVAPNADAQRALQAAQAQNLNTQGAKTATEAGLLPGDAAATQAAQYGAAGLSNASARAVPGTTASENALRGAQTTSLGIANTQGTAAGYGGLAGFGGTVPAAGNLGGSGTVNPNTPGLQGDETGGRVLSKGEVAIGKAKKPGPTDTVPTMLTPGEAVLNKGAAQHYGTDVIDHMNKMGLMRMGAQTEMATAMGQPDPHAPPQTAKRDERKAKQSKAA